MLLTKPLLAADDAIGNIAAWIRQGNAHQLATIFAENVEVTLPGDNKTYTKTGAEQALTGFFAQNPHSQVRLLHKVASNANYQYAVLSLSSGRNSYRVNITLKQINGSPLLIELRIEARGR